MRIEIAVILCEFVCALLDLGHVNRRDVLNFRTREATVRNRGRLRQFGLSSTLKRKHITLCQRIRDRSASGKYRCAVCSVDALDQIKQLVRNAIQFNDQLLRSFRRLIAFLDLGVCEQSRLKLRDSLLAISA
jgi:hypothetical protein